MDWTFLSFKNNKHVESMNDNEDKEEKTKPSNVEV